MAVALRLSGLLAAGCGVRDMAGSSAAVSKVIDTLFQGADLGAWNASYEGMMAPEFRQVTSKEDFEKLGRTIQGRLGKITSKNTSGFFVRNLNGVLTVEASYDAQFEKGKGTIHSKLKKSGDNWQFVNFRVNSPVFLEEATLPCKSCGKPRPKDASFCPACGKKIEEATAAPSPK